MGEVAVRRLLRRFGIEVTRYPTPNTLPWQLQQVISRLRIRQVIDVGAHDGGFARLLREVVRYSGPLVSFEPSAASFSALEKDRAKDDFWSGHNVALGSERDELTLNTFTGSDFNSFMEPNSYGKERFTGLRQKSYETVRVERLDSYPVSPGSLLKIDTQGFDLQVMEGASGVLSSICAVVIELPVRPIYRSAPGINAMMSRLAAWGFEPAGLFPVSRQHDRLRVVEFDGVFLRTGMAHCPQVD